MYYKSIRVEMSNERAISFFFSTSTYVILKHYYGIVHSTIPHIGILAFADEVSRMRGGGGWRGKSIGYYMRKTPPIYVQHQCMRTFLPPPEPEPPPERGWILLSRMVQAHT